MDPEQTRQYLDLKDTDVKVSDILKSSTVLTRHQPETCSGFKVGRSQRPGKFRHLDVSGVVAVTCIRHGVFYENAMVDLQKGER